MNSIDWREYIVADAAVLAGKPRLKGTRLSIEFVLELLAAGWDRAALRDNYPNLTDEGIRAAVRYVGRSTPRSAVPG